MRSLVLGVLVSLAASGVAIAASDDASQPKRERAWGCKVEREPARKRPEGAPAARTPREGRLYLLDQPEYCNAPKAAPERGPAGKTPRRT